MFDVSFWELVMILVVALIVVGPERLPGLARTLGLWISRARRIVGEVRGEVERELRIEEVKRAMQQPGEVEEFKKLADRVKAINADVQTTLREPAVPPSPTPNPPSPPVESAPAPTPEHAVSTPSSVK